MNRGDVGVWLVTLPTTDACYAKAWSVLGQDERERANRLMREEDRTLWIGTRALLRRVLAARLSTEPEFIVFGEGPNGKPALSEPAGSEWLHFSVSHSGAVAAIAVARDRRVGIDVERIQQDLSWEPIAARFFSSADVAVIKDRPPADRSRAFFDCWVRKESYLKGLGLGLTRALDDFSVPTGSAAGVVEDPAVRASSGVEHRWRVHPIDVPDGYVAALAVQGGPRG
jgi:4'-phosphopantetheinyl transferase